ncbi:hypothetical protein OYC64_006716 [Pagothenia borchgrevinki]|uniref:Endonuclease/exonuclease/phosphatase domain-containing protein n=1 Tax=Pagothenia borchgrevinki TaxID=8213 RepID=A0ABD2GKL2_PAGBO
MNNKTSNISKLITENKLDVFFSTETWLKSETTADNVLEEASPPNFRSFHHVSSEDGRRGVATQVSPVLHGRDKRVNNIKTFECVVTILEHKEWEKRVLSINLYRPPVKNLITIRNFLDEFQELLNMAYKKYNNIIVTGDFNIWVDCDNKTYVKEFLEFLRVNSFGMHPNEPTFSRSTHFLDLVLFRNVEVSGVKVREDQISDHYTVYFKWRPVQRD